MTTITAFIERHPLLTYYTLTFAISWGGMLMVIGGQRENLMMTLVSPLFTLARMPIVSCLGRQRGGDGTKPCRESERHTRLCKRRPRHLSSSGS